MSKPLSETHGDYLIEYSLDRNKWIVTLGGVLVSKRDSLLNARKAVEEENKAKKEFARHPVLYREGYGGDVFKRAEVTSYAEPCHGDSGCEVWISIPQLHGKATRNKVAARTLFESTPDNEEIMTEIVSIRDAENALNRRKEKAIARLTKYTLRKSPYKTPQT